MAIWQCVFLALALHLALAKDQSLKFVTVIWRHGDRAPSDKTFPTDKGNTDSSWPQGFGELTDIGMRQHQHLGRYLRKRYVEDKGFLSTDYKSKEIYVRSTSFNRTIMSALSNMAGMYPPPNGSEFLQGITWQPIPIHSQPREIDPMLWMDCPCPREVELYQNEIMQSQEIKAIEKANKHFLQFVRIKAGVEKLPLDDVWDIWDPLNCERIHNDTHTWPDWVTPEIFKNLTHLTELSTRYYYHDPRIQRFRGGMLFNEIALRMHQKATGQTAMVPADLKYFVYSAHDTTMMALLENLGCYYGHHAHLPEYATAILFELHEMQGKYSVQTWYVNETWPTKDPVRLEVKNCDLNGVDCTLETFASIASSRAPGDWLTECGITANVSQPRSATIAAIILGITTAISTLAFLITLFMHCNRGQKKGKISEANIQNGRGLARYS